MIKAERCDIFCFDEHKVKRVKDKLDTYDITQSVKLFKLLADENKAKIIYALSEESELCVCDLSHIVNSTISNTSFHLRSLFKQQIVTCRKEGKLAFYALQHSTISQYLSIYKSIKRGEKSESL